MKSGSSLRRRFPRTYIGVRNLLRTRIRTTLAVVAILIGVATIASLGTFGVAYENAQREAIGELGSDIEVVPGEDTDGALTEADIRELERIKGPTNVVPISYRESEYRDGTIDVYLLEQPADLYDVKDGVIPDNWRNGVLVGETVAERDDIRPGQQITVMNESFRVAAVLHDEGQLSIARPNEAIIAPHDSVDDERYTVAVVLSDDAAASTETANRIRDELNEREDRVRVFEHEDVADQLDQAYTYVNWFLLAVGSVSLLVAGVCIVTVMLMSVIERREEIGVLRAVGYQRRDVLNVMLVEAALLGLVGSAAGVLLSLVAIAVINWLLLGDPTAVDPKMLQYVTFAFVFGVVVSLLAGLYPAWKAASEPPVEALDS